MALTLLLLVPGAAGVWLAVARRARPAQSNAIALVASAVTFVVVVVCCAVRPEVDARWVPAIGVRWHFAVDGISVPLLLLTGALVLLVVVYSRGREPGRDVPGGSGVSTFYGCLMIVELGALAIFLARDAVLFFVAFEVVLVPMWVLISRFGDPHRTERERVDAAGRFVFFTALGSTLMLVGILLLVTLTGTSDLTELAAARGAGLSSTDQALIAGLLVVGLSIKIPVWPLHTWLPPAHTVAPTAGSVLLAAVLLKMGTYGVVRLAVPTVPEGFRAVAPLLAGAGVVGIIWGGLACLVERDLKRLIAFSSVAHMGFVALGLASGTQTGLQGALFANIAHGVVSALLFLVVGSLKDRWGGSADLGTARAALRDVAPRMGYVLVVGFAAALGLPGLVGFWGEFLAVNAAWSAGPGLPAGYFKGCAVVAVVGLAIAAAYSLRVLRLVWAGHADWAGPPQLPQLPQPPQPPQSEQTSDARGSEWAVLAVLAVAVIAGGLLPRPLLAVTADDAALLTGATVAASGTLQAGVPHQSVPAPVAGAATGGRP